jgi:WD40 repeat protein
MSRLETLVRMNVCIVTILYEYLSFSLIHAHSLTVTLLVGASSNRLYLWETHDKNTNQHSQRRSKQPFSDKTRNHQTKHTSQTFQLSDERKTRVPIVHIKWIERTKTFVTGSSNGLVQIWKVAYEHDNRVLKHSHVPGAKLSKRYRMVRLQQIKGHTENITSVCSIDSMELLVTAGMDKQIRVHDIMVPLVRVHV